MNDWIEQYILNVFSEAFEESLNDPELNHRIQAVKASLYERNYPEAFGNQANLDAYVVRWSPSRALGYRHLLQSLGEVNNVLTKKRNGSCKVLCVGGGAGGEVVALSSIALLNDGGPKSAQKLEITAVDMAQWDQTLQRIMQNICKSWYEPGAGEVADLSELLSNMCLNGPLSVKFIQHDILTLQIPLLNELDLITSMFTTNELFASSKAGTVRFLKSLSACKTGALLLLVESAGSYSEIQIGQKKFPVQYLIDHTLKDDWSLVSGEDSRWYRVPNGLQYAMSLENMRFFYRLYRRN